MVVEKVKQDQKKKIRRVIRISEEAYNRLKTASEIKHLTISGANAIAINIFADSVEYNYENVMEEISKQPLLKLNKESLSKMFKDADEETIEAVVKILKEGIVSFYEFGEEHLDKFLSEMKNIPCKKIVPIVRINFEINLNKEVRKKIDEIFQKFRKFNCPSDEQILDDVSLDKKDLIKITIFLLKKEEKKNGLSS